jgi:hypothetical protein
VDAIAVEREHEHVALQLRARERDGDPLGLRAAGELDDPELGLAGRLADEQLVERAVGAAALVGHRATYPVLGRHVAGGTRKLRDGREGNVCSPSYTP